MKKFLKIFIGIVLALLFVTPVVFGITITGINDSIAEKTAKEISLYPLPENTNLCDTVCAARKLVGNGNGMQYMGAILVTSELTEEELRAYYSEAFDFVEVRLQESADIDYVNNSDYSFENFDSTNGKTYYSVTLWGSARKYYPDWVVTLLNYDLRGH